MADALEIASFEERDGVRILRLSGELDQGAARRLADRVLRLGTNEVLLDFSGVAIEDRALEALARLVCCSDRVVRLTGLRDHHLRLLDWLGAGEQPQP